MTEEELAIKRLEDAYNVLLKKLEWEYEQARYFESYWYGLYKENRELRKILIKQGIYDLPKSTD